MSVVHAVRHGQVDNPDGVLYERLPGYHLTEAGRRMAAETARFFRGRPITHLCCSPLERTQETMAPIAELFPDVTVVIDPRVIEAGNRFAGQVMGSTASAAKYPKNWRHLINPFRPSWGEPYAVIADRMTAAILDAARIVGSDGEAIIVSHQLPIWVARLRAEGTHLWHDPRRRVCALASVTSFHVTDDVITGLDYAEPAAALLGHGVRYGFGA